MSGEAPPAPGWVALVAESSPKFDAGVPGSKAVAHPRKPVRKTPVYAKAAAYIAQPTVTTMTGRASQEKSTGSLGRRSNRPAVPETAQPSVPPSTDRIRQEKTTGSSDSAERRSNRFSLPGPERQVTAAGDRAPLKRFIREPQELVHEPKPLPIDSEEDEEEDEEEADEEDEEEDEAEDEEEDEEDEEEEDADDNEENEDDNEEDEELEDNKPNIKPNLSQLPDFLSQIANEASQSSRNAKRGSADVDIKPKLEHIEPQVPHVPGPFSKLSDEAIIEIAHCLIDEDAYASATSLVGMCRRTRQLLRPVMKKAKKKVVLDLDDLRWSNKKTWKDIQIITCTSDSALPFRAETFSTKQGQRAMRQGLLNLKPWAIIQKGAPDDATVKLQEHAFPTVKLIRCNTNTTMDELTYLSVENPIPKNEWVVDSTNNIIHALHNRSLSKPFGLPTLRLKFHDDYAFDLRQSRPGQMFVRWVVSECKGGVVVEKESWTVTQLDKMQDDLKDWLWDSAEHSLPFEDTTGFETISLDLYFEPRPSSTGLFYSVDDEFPPAYDVLSQYAEEAAEKWLEATSLKPIADFKLRFFVLHGEFMQREKMKPVYRTHRAKKFDGAVTVRELYIDDDDFAWCVKKGGCSRCKPEKKR